MWESALKTFQADVEEEKEFFINIIIIGLFKINIHMVTPVSNNVQFGIQKQQLIRQRGYRINILAWCGE